MDLSVLLGEKVVFIRTLRLPHVAEDEKQYRPLLGELRRTIAAFHNQFPEVRISSITICGDPGQRVALAEAVEEEFGLPTNVLHPLESVGGTASFKESMPEHPGRFAPLVGMVLDEAAGSHAIDFLNPRRKPEARTNYRMFALAGAAALLLLAWYTWWQYDRLADKRRAVELLEAQIAQTREHYDDQLAAVKQRVDRLDPWMQTDVIWLDELSEASLALRPRPLQAPDFPAGEDVVVTNLVLEALRANYDIAAKIDDAPARIRARIRDGEGDDLDVQSVPSRENARSGYPWSFEATEVVAAPDLDYGG
jgi:hypothetical protein